MTSYEFYYAEYLEREAMAEYLEAMAEEAEAE